MAIDQRNHRAAPPDESEPDAQAPAETQAAQQAQSAQDAQSAQEAQQAQSGEAIARAAEALLREHPDAIVAGLSSNGLIVPIPGAVALWGQETIEGRAVIDHVVAGDRNKMVELW